MVNRPGNNNEQHAGLMRTATSASVTIALTLIVIKVFAYIMTGSVALLSSLIDSVLDAFASVLNMIAVKHSLTPADDEHRFGHGKAEALAGLGQAAFISGSSIFLVFEALNRLVNPRPIENSMIGIIVILISLALTMALVLFQKYVVRHTGSIAIQADSIHYQSDVALNLGVIAAIVLGSRFGWHAADPVFALGIAVWVIYSAWTIVNNAFDQLMDRELPDQDRAAIVRIAMAHNEVRDMHGLRTRASGQDVFIQLHLEMDVDITLMNAHRIADEVEEELRKEFPNADVIIHEDPVGLETDVE